SSSAAPSPSDDGSGGSDNSNSNSGSSGSDSGSSGSSSPPSGSSSGFTTAPSYCGGPAADSGHANGQEWYLNCGMDGSGWAPPFVTLDQLAYTKLRDAVNSGSGVFDPCAAYVDTFEQVAASTGVPDIFLASFAMQESTCNPGAVGPNGEQGLMQLTVDKCGGAPGGNCQDVWFNINTGANYIQTTISQAGGNVVEAVGQYNGWQTGQTISSVISNGNCGAQQNLDYLNEFFNYWLNN
ncbi:glycoside hydrolase family 23 protein, partial [Calocera cornea HHB12733]